MANITERDLDGKIKKAVLDSETAAQMAALRWSKPRQERIERLLRDRGINTESADEGLYSLAELATSNKAGAVYALRYLDQLTKRDDNILDVPRVEFLEGCDKVVKVNDKYYLELAYDDLKMILAEIGEIKLSRERGEAL